MNDDFKEIVLFEIRENRKSIGKVNEKLAAMDKKIFSNKMKLSLFIGGVSIGFSFVTAIVLEKIKAFF